MGLKSLWLTLLVSALFLGCIKSKQEAFPAPPDLSTTRTEFLDTFTVHLSTYRFDSLNTTSRLRLFAGKYTDPVLGTVETKGFFQMLPVSYNVKYPDNFIRIDSARIFLRYDHQYGKPGVEDFKLFRLTQNLDGDKSYYQFSPEPTYASDSILSTTNQSKKFRFININALPLAEQIVAKWKELGSFSNDKQFLDFLPGLAIVSKYKIDQITGFNLQDSAGFPPTFMRIYYKYKDGDDSLRSQFDLNVDSRSVQFFTAKPNYSGTQWANIPVKEGLPSAQSNSISVMQGVTALATRMSIPGLQSWQKGQDKKLKIFKAELEVTPEYSGIYDLPPFIRICRNEDYFMINESAANIVYNDESIFKLLQANYTTASAKNQTVSQVFAYNSSTNKFKCNITSYIQSVIDGSNTSTTFNVYPLFWNSALNRMVITQGNVKLKVFYYPL